MICQSNTQTYGVASVLKNMDKTENSGQGGEIREWGWYS